MNFSERSENEMSETADKLGEQEKGGEEEKPLKKEKAEWEENPDLEDPRLYSPLQEPDRPAPHERVADEPEQKPTPPD